MAEHLTRNEKVVSSILTSSSKQKPLISNEISGLFYIHAGAIQEQSKVFSDIHIGKSILIQCASHTGLILIKSLATDHRTVITAEL